MATGYRQEKQLLGLSLIEAGLLTRDQLDKAVMNYLRVIQGQYTDMGFQRAINEFIDALQEKLIDE